VSGFDEPTRTTGPPPGEGSRSVGVLAGRYRVLALLGAGGMGSVYLADDLELGERVAVKMLRSEYSHDADFVERLRSEVRLARRVTHRNVARTYDIAEHEGERFLTMEYIAGESLAARIARDRALPFVAFFRIAKDIVAGLEAAHVAGVVHRDLKPQNILLADDGRAVVTDFGTAWSTDAMSEDRIAGTPSYMAPEQFEGVFDERSDLFALGVVLHMMLTGAKPFTSEPGERPARAPNPCDYRPGVPVPLGALVEKCLAHVPSQRPASAVVVAAELDAVASLLLDDSLQDTVSAGPAASVLRGVALEPRTILMRGIGDASGSPTSRGVREELAKHINEHGALYATAESDRPHEVAACVDVRQEGDRLVVDVGLVGGPERFQFWRATFDGTKASAVDLARAAARGIEEALAVDVPAPPLLDPLGREATRLYLAGRLALQDYWPDSLKRAAFSFEEALTHAPEHAVILAALATTRARQCFFSEGFIDVARATSELAVSLAPELAEAHVARAAVLTQDMEPEAAVRSLFRAVELAPGQVDALSALGRILLEAGAPSDAVRLATAAYARDHADIQLLIEARAHALLGDMERALSIIGRMLRTRNTVGLVTRARFALWQRDPQGLRAIGDELRALGTSVDSRQFTLFFVTLRAVLERRPPRATDPDLAPELGAEASRARRSVVRQWCAEAAAYLGDHASALGFIESAIDEGLYDTLWLSRCPLFNELLGNVRFEAAREIVDGRARRVLQQFYVRSAALD
jgi:eukaryotic-like serine/threonine-protein kinase